jgi:ADP-ribosyl-[dinitrogen reductase] hydrolase
VQYFGGQVFAALGQPAKVANCRGGEGRLICCKNIFMIIPISREDILDRARAAFLGVAVGDALGAGLEFMTPGEIQAKYTTVREIIGGGWLRLKPGQITDDTDMSLCIARALKTAGGWSLPAIAEAFAAWLRTKPIDVGDTCRRGIRNYMLKGQLASPFNQWDAGNGACMRMAPVALCTLGSDELLQRYTLEQAHLTHNHPLSDAACLAAGRQTHLSLLGYSKSRLRRDLEPFLAEFENFRFEPYRGMASAYVVDTMQTVFHYFFKTRDFESCLVATVNQGGDADTTGAIVGMLAGAYYGMDAIPKRWLKKLDKKLVDEIISLADLMLALSPLGKSAAIPQSSEI